jgi:sec-independent protein translocase protein TatC
MRKTGREADARVAAAESAGTGGQDRPFLEHLEELRRRLLAVAAWFAAAALVAFAFADPFLDALEAPARAVGAALAALRPQDLFLSRVRAALALAALATFPFALVQLRAFVAPALGRRERRRLDAALWAACLLGAAGLAAAALILVPFLARFFAAFGADRTTALWGLDAWYALAIGTALGASLAFEAPLVLAALFAVGALDPRAVARRRREAVVAIFVIAAVATPPDALSQALVALPLWLLFELALVAGRALSPSSRDKEAMR